MGINYAPFLADIFLYSYEAEFISLSSRSSGKLLASNELIFNSSLKKSSFEEDGDTNNFSDLHLEKAYFPLYFKYATLLNINI